MRGMFIHDGMQFQLEVKGDEYIPGDELTGSLRIKNHGTAPRLLGAALVTLALGNVKKAKAKQPDAFEPVERAVMSESVELAASEEKSFPFSLKLAANSPVTEKNQSLFLVYGAGDEALARSELRVTVLPHPHVRTIYDLLESSFQCVLKGEKSTGEWVAAKFAPSSSRKLSLVKDFLLKSRFDGDALELEYVFNVKQFDTTATSVAVKQGKNTVSQRLEAGEYLLPGGFVNHETINRKVSEALAVVSTEL